MAILCLKCVLTSLKKESNQIIKSLNNNSLWTYQQVIEALLLQIMKQQSWQMMILELTVKLFVKRLEQL